MSKDVYDLVVRIQNEMVALRKASGYHPADVNALLKGVFTGLNLGLNYLEARNTGNGELVLTFLAGGRHNSLAINLDMANARMPENRPFTAEMFVGLRYRTSERHEFYEKGMRWGFRYVMDLYEAFRDPNSGSQALNTTIEYLWTVTNTLNSM